MLRLLKPVVTLTLGLMIVSISCSIPLLPTAAPSPTNTAIIPPPATSQPVATTAAQATPTSRNALSTKVLIRVTTTSDWTHVRLVSGATWANPTSMSSSPEATAATIEGDLISLSQTLAQAQAGQEVRISSDILFNDLDPSGQLVFDIERGFIGSTQVEISAYSSGQPVLLKTFIWDKTNEANGNLIEVRLPVADLLAPPTAIAKPNDYITVAQLNLWFHGPGCYGGFEAFNCNGKRNTNLIPALGATYESADPDVIRQQIDWATAYGVDAFSIEWTTPREVSGSIENILNDNFLKAPTLNKMRWCIFYDLVLRLQQTPGLNIDWSRGLDFDNPDVYNTFVSDFAHFAKKYFNHPQYLKIDERPVLYIWGTWNATGRFVEAFRDARKAAADLGYDVYLVGDILRTQQFDPTLAAAYDANTNFLFFTADPDSMTKDVGEAAVKLDGIFTHWEQKIAGLKVAGRQDEVILQPGFAPQFDNRLLAEVNNEQGFIYIPAQSKDQVTAMAEVVRQHAHPAGSQNLKLVWLNTWNNWAETTTFEPTADSGPKYPAGNYQFDMVEVIRNVFGAEIFPPQ
jgi:hypothetical protein